MNLFWKKDLNFKERWVNPDLPIQLILFLSSPTKTIKKGKIEKNLQVRVYLWGFVCWKCLVSHTFMLKTFQTSMLMHKRSKMISNLFGSYHFHKISNKFIAPINWEACFENWYYEFYDSWFDSNEQDLNETLKSLCFKI